jgi:hypothetical protein
MDLAVRANSGTVDAWRSRVQRALWACERLNVGEIVASLVPVSVLRLGDGGMM